MTKKILTFVAFVVCGEVLFCTSTFAKQISSNLPVPVLGRAIAERNSDVENNPLDPSAFDRRANTLMEAKRYIEALRDSDTAVQLNPSFPEYYATRGFARWHLKDFEGGKRDFLYAAALVYVQGDIGLVRRAMLKSLGDDYDGAEADLDAVLKFGDDVRIHEVRAHIRKRRGDHIGKISDDLLKSLKEAFPTSVPLIRSLTIKQASEQN